ncbi:MAG: acyl carrier protein [Francisellaceae bacterium]|jgi:acyl carrier protein
MTGLILEVKELIIHTLNLEDMTPDDINVDEVLFGDGLGLDSIDALELGVAIKKKYNITINSDDDHAKEYFKSVNSLVKFIKENGK